jgi:arylsulfatase A-like enzyme
MYFRMDRRSFLKQASLSTVSLLLSSCSSAVPKAVRSSHPNVIVILADDMGYGDLACQNQDSKIPTPNLDRMAGQGVRFTDAHSPSGVCTPTRYSMLTGRYCWRSRLKRGVLGPWAPPLIEKDRLTVPALLKKQGYRSACIGKWHLGWDWPFTAQYLESNETDRRKMKRSGVDFVDWSKPIMGGPLACGFDYYFGDDVPNFPPYVFIENDRTLGVPAAVKSREMFGAIGPMLPGWELEAVMPTITRKAVEWIDKSAKSKDPFFLYFSLTAPHLPVVPMKEFKGKSSAGEYGDFVVEVDWSVGEVLKALERNGLEKDTLVIFTSDNGPERFAYSRIKEYKHYSMGRLRGLKRDTWEGGHRVPFIARWDGKIKPATVSDEVICLVDMMGTLAAIAGADIPETAGEDSYNVMPALLGQKLKSPIREATVSHGEKGTFAIRKGDWVLIDAPTGDTKKIEPEWFKAERGYQKHDFPAELFNLKDDRAEKQNLYAKFPEKVTELKLLLEKYKKDGRSVPMK